VKRFFGAVLIVSTQQLVTLSLLVAGCSGHTHSSVTFVSVGAAGGVSTHIESGAGLAALLGIAVVASSVGGNEPGLYGAGNPRQAPEMDPGRRVSEQDCTKPLDLSLGNIRCK
jgi:hypothetical protein